MFMLFSLDTEVLVDFSDRVTIPPRFFYNRNGG